MEGIVMTGEQIREKIREYNRQISEVVEPISFVLNEETNRLLKEIEKLQKICNHNYKEKVCIYCGVEELD